MHRQDLQTNSDSAERESFHQSSPNSREETGSETERRFPERLNKEHIKNLPLLAFEGKIHLISETKDLSDAIKILRRDSILGFDITDVMFKGSAEDLKKTDITQPAIFIHSTILFTINSTNAHAYAGHSLGEFSALSCSGSLIFEDALKLNPNALDGSAYTSLGALYYQVPGWPIGFGDDDKAEELLKKSVTMNPDSIDSLYFYGEYLVDQKRYAEAEQVLQHALKAAPRPNRKVADAGRRQEIQSSLSTIKDKLN